MEKRVKPKNTHFTSKSILLFISLTGLFLLLFVFCAGPKIKTTLLVPAKAHEAAELRRIAVLQFVGPTGYEVGVDIEALLVGIRIDDEPYFKVIDRASIKEIIKEHHLQMTDMVDEKTAVTIGKLIGVQGVILGTVTQNVIEDKDFRETRSKCLEKDKDGKCIKRRKYKVRCTERDAYFSFTPKIINVATGLIVASETLSGHSYDKICRDLDRPLRGAAEMNNITKNQAIEKFRQMIAPNYITIEITLIKKDETKPSSEAKEKIERGINWAKQGRLDRACEYWDEAYNLHPKGYAIHYLLGVCAETAGKLQMALSYYEKADRITDRPINEINDALDRVRVHFKNRRNLWNRNSN